MLSPSQEYCHCHRRDAPLMLRARHPTTITVFLAHSYSMLSPFEENCQLNHHWDKHVLYLHGVTLKIQNIRRLATQRCLHCRLFIKYELKFILSKVWTFRVLFGFYTQLFCGREPSRMSVWYVFCDVSGLV